MIQFTRSGIAPVGGPVRAGRAQPVKKARAGSTGGQYDQVTISAHENDPFMMEMKSRIAQDVRTATTTGEIGMLHDQVQAGEYKIDAGNIARKMLLLGEV